MVNSTCPRPKDYEEYLTNGRTVVGPLTTQHLLLLISIAAAGIATAASMLLIMKHLHRYTNPKQQRQIVRITFTPVVFSVLSAVSLTNYKVAEYMIPLIDLYETFALASLFLLFVEFVTPDPNTRDMYFDNLQQYQVKGIPCAKSRKIIPIDGGSLRWYQSKIVAVFGYCIIDVLMTGVQEITQATNDYCETSYSPRFAHIWVFLITNFVLGWAIEGIIRFYYRLRKEPDFAQHGPGLKMVSFKLIVSINFLQSTIFDLLLSTGAVKGGRTVTGNDLKYGIPATLVAIEQIFFALFFHYSFRSQEYREAMKTDINQHRLGIFRAAANAFNPSDLLSSMFQAVKLLLSGVGPVGNGSFRKPNSRGRRGNRFGVGQGDSQSHLEPMTYRPGHVRTESPYGGSGSYPGINVETEDTAYGPSGPLYAPPPSHPPQSSGPYQRPPDYDDIREPAQDDESTTLYPGGYQRSHSRDPSIDGDARSARQMF